MTTHAVGAQIASNSSAEVTLKSSDLIRGQSACFLSDSPPSEPSHAAQRTRHLTKLKASPRLLIESKASTQDKGKAECMYNLQDWRQAVIRWTRILYPPVALLGTPRACPVYAT